MSLSLISSAYAADAAAQQGGGMFSMLPLFILIVVFYFLILRPQQKRSKEQITMISALQKGDEVVTSGGIMGRIANLDDNYAGIEVAANVVIQVQKTSVQSVLPKGTIKSN